MSSSPPDDFPLDEPPAYLDEVPVDYPPDYYQSAAEPESSEMPEPNFSPRAENASVDALFGGPSAAGSRAVNPLLIDQLTEGLNQEQLQSVTAADGHLLVLAGAGSGKTRVLTHRIAWLLAQGRAVPPQILAVTFTNKAAKEMTERLQGLSIRQIYAMWIGTFHGLCHRFLRRHYEAAGLSSTFQVMDTDAQISVVRQICEAKGINAEEFPPRELLGWINACKEKGERSASIKGKGQEFETQLAVYQSYEAYCQKENLVDFAELMVRCKELFTRNERIRNHYRAQFRYLLVDEFQDTNTMQYELLQLLCGDQASIFAVGDDDQSIYGFRGAKIENLRDFEKKYAKGKVIRLEQSYRSTSNILNAANTLIANNQGRMGKTLWTAQSGGEPIHVFPAYNDEEEARWMMSTIHQFAEQGLPWSDVAILYRINAHSRAFEQAAIRAGIPYRITGGFRFYDRAEIRHALAYLRLIANPHDATSLMRVVNFPPRGIGERSMAQLRDIAEAKSISLMSAINFMEGRSAQALFSFAQLIMQMREAISAMTLPDMISHVISASGLQVFFQNQRDGKERLENLDELVNAASQYEQERERRAAEGELDETDALTLSEGEAPVVANARVNTPSLIEQMEAPTNNDAKAEAEMNIGQSALVRFLSDAVLDSAEPASSEKSSINMMSVHAAKGLEFSAVFIGGLEHGTFPHENNSNIEEERRLMYVALTRAKKNLHLSYTHQRLLHGRVRQNIPSLFLEEIPKDLIHMLRPASAALMSEQARAQGYGGREGKAPWPKTPGESASAGSPVRDFNKTLESLGVTKGMPTSPSSPTSSQSAPPFALGQHVHHPKFGPGVVYQYEGAGKDTRILVSFGALGQKWLLLSLAKLSSVA